MTTDFQLPPMTPTVPPASPAAPSRTVPNEILVEDLPHAIPDAIEINDYLTRSTFSLLVSPPGVGKSTFLLSLALAIGYDRPDIIGQTKPFKWTEGGIACIFNEDSQETIGLRVRAIMTKYGIPAGTKPKHPVVLHAGGSPLLLASGNPGSRTGLPLNDETLEIRQICHRQITMTDAKNTPALILIDTLASSLHNVDENSVGHMMELCRILTGLAEHMGAAVLVTHHSTKTAAMLALTAANPVSNVYAARGSGSLSGAARTIFDLRSPSLSENSSYGWDGDGTKRVCLDIVKSQTTPGGPHTWFAFEPVQIDTIIPDLTQVDANRQVVGSLPSTRTTAVLVPLKPVAGGGTLQAGTAPVLPKAFGLDEVDVSLLRIAGVLDKGETVLASTHAHVAGSFRTRLGLNLAATRKLMSLLQRQRLLEVQYGSGGKHQFKLTPEGRARVDELRRRPDTQVLDLDDGDLDGDDPGDTGDPKSAEEAETLFAGLLVPGKTP